MLLMVALNQAYQLIKWGFKLGFGGSLTYERSLQIRRLAQTLPLNAIVLETDAPDMVPQWLHVKADQRISTIGQPYPRNEPKELPSIGVCLAELRRDSLQLIAAQTSRNAKELFSIQSK